MRRADLVLPPPFCKEVTDRWASVPDLRLQFLAHSLPALADKKISPTGFRWETLQGSLARGCCRMLTTGQWELHGSLKVWAVGKTRTWLGRCLVPRSIRWRLGVFRESHVRRCSPSRRACLPTQACGRLWGAILPFSCPQESLWLRLSASWPSAGGKGPRGELRGLRPILGPHQKGSKRGCPYGPVFTRPATMRRCSLMVSRWVATEALVLACSGWRHSQS